MKVITYFVNFCGNKNTYSKKQLIKKYYHVESIALLVYIMNIYNFINQFFIAPNLNQQDQKNLEEAERYTYYTYNFNVYLAHKMTVVLLQRDGRRKI